MTDFIKKLEKEFDIQIIHSNKHIIGENYYDVDKEGNIKTLYLYDVNLKDLSVLLPIADNLVNLAVKGCNIRTLGAIKSFTQLQALSLRSNRLHSSTLRHLNHLKNLKYLNLFNTHLKDTSLLGDLIGLETLDIGGWNPYREISGLEQLKSLRYLEACYIFKVNSIGKINVNENLRSLNFGNTFIEKITDLERFPYLEELRLGGQEMKKIEGLDTLHHLKKLSFGNSIIEKIEGLENLINLEMLELRSNYISEITGLDNLKNLKVLNLDENEIPKIENLDNLINLELLLLRTYNTDYFDTNFFNNLVSECHIYVGNRNADKLKAVAPKNVKINFDKDFPYPTSLYATKDFFQ